MPTLPTYQRRVVASPAGVAQISSSDPVGSALGQIGGAIANIGDVLQRQQLISEANRQKQSEEAARVWAGEASGANMLRESEALNNAYTTAPADGAGVAETFLKGFDERAAKLSQSAPDPTSREYIRQHLQTQRNHLGAQAQIFQFKARDANIVNRHIDAIQTWAKVVEQNPRQFQVAMVALDETRPDVQPEMRSKLIEGQRVALSDAAASKMLATTPAQLFDLTSRALNITAPAPSRAGGEASVPSQAGGAAVAPSPGGAEFDQVNAIQSQLLAGPEQLRVLRAEASNPAYDQGTRDAVQREITRVERTRRSIAPIAAPQPSVLNEAPELSAGKPMQTGVAFVDLANVDQLLRWRREAHTEMQRGLATERNDLASRVKDLNSMALSGVAPPPSSIPSREDYVRVYGQESAHHYDAEVGSIVELGNALRQMQNSSATDRDALIAKYNPVPGPGFDHQQRLQGALVQASTLIEKQLAADPAAYALRSAPKIATAQNAMIQTVSDAKASDTDRRDAVNAYAWQMLAEQQRLGVPNLRIDERGVATRMPTMMRLLTNAQANSIAQQVSTSGANAATMLDGLAKQWGTHWPAVYGQLAADNKLPPYALAIPNMADPLSRERLARWSMPDQLKGMKERLPAGADKDIEISLLRFNEPFYASLALQDGGPKTYSTALAAQTTLATGYMAEGKSAKEAAQQAFQETVGHAYHFDGTLRIPNAQQPQQVLGGARAVLGQVDLLDLRVPPGRPGLTPKAARVAWNDVVRSRGFFVANGDESGAQLYVTAANPSSGMQGVAQVLDNDGRPVSFSWSQLRNLYAAQPSASSSDDALQKALAKGDGPTATQILRDRARQRYEQQHQKPQGVR